MFTNILLAVIVLFGGVYFYASLKAAEQRKSAVRVRVRVRKDR